MPIKKNIIIKASDGSDYKFNGIRFIDIVTGRPSSPETYFELERKAIQRGLTEGDSIFTELLNMSVANGMMPERTRNSRQWMQNEAFNYGKKSDIKMRSEILSETKITHAAHIRIGRPVFFKYEAKYKAKLPYFDMYPIVIPISIAPDGKSFLGLNFHYLNFPMRALLLDALYKVRVGVSKRTGEIIEQGRGGIIPIEGDSANETRFDISYTKLLQGISKYKWFKPTVHKYLLNGKNVQSKFLEIPPIGWTLMFFLPLAKWNKSNDIKVWQDSADKIDGKDL